MTSTRTERIYLLGNGAQWKESNRDHGKPLEPIPKRLLRQKLVGIKLYSIEARMVPEGDLNEFAKLITERLGMDESVPALPTDRALYMYGWSYGWSFYIGFRIWADWLAKKLGPGVLVKNAAIRVRKHSGR